MTLVNPVFNFFAAHLCKFFLVKYTGDTTYRTGTVRLFYLIKGTGKPYTFLNFVYSNVEVPVPSALVPYWAAIFEEKN